MPAPTWRLRQPIQQLHDSLGRFLYYFVCARLGLMVDMSKGGEALLKLASPESENLGE